jgi:ATP-binding cassette subfamily F protein uup
MADPAFYRQAAEEITRAAGRFRELEEELQQAYERWEELEGK